ncbi:MAG TPA: CHAD domain-containing protein [Chthoniobacterales bacterium]
MKSAKVSLRRNETLREGLLRSVDCLTDSIIKQSPSSANDEETTHQIRTTIKRLRALLRLTRPGLDPAFFEQENDRLRSEARILSSARDSEVARDTLRTLPMNDQSRREAVDAVLSGLEPRIQREKAHQPNLNELKEDARETRTRFRRVKFRGTEQQIIETGIRKVYRQGRQRMKEAIRTEEDAAYHRWRIRAKNLYYELQFLETVWPKRLHQMVSRLSKLQDRIGLDHDLVVLRAELKRTPEVFGGKERVGRIVSCLDRQIKKSRRSAIPLGRKIWQKTPKRFARQLARHWQKNNRESV